MFVLFNLRVGTKQTRLLLREAMIDGHVQSQISKILLYGAAGTGKSSFMDLNTGNTPSQTRRSTPLAARPVTVFQIDMTHLSHSEWAKLTPQQRKKVLVKAAIRRRIEASQESGSGSEEAQTEAQIRERETPVSIETTTAGVKHTEAGATNLHRETPPTSPRSPARQNQSSSQGISVSTYDDLIQLVDQHAVEGETITTYRKLYLIDSGGQPQFHEMLPAFLRGMTLCVFVFKLSEELTTKPMVEYYNQRGEPVGTPYQSPHTNQQLLEHCLRTLRTHRPSPDSQVKPSKIMVVGTHRDKEDPDPQVRAEKRAEKNRIISDLLLPSFQEESVFYNLCTEEFIFPVNAKNPQEEDRDVVRDFQHLVLTECTPEPVDVPLQYYALEILLEEYSEKVGREVLSVEEVLAAASQLHFERDSLEAALQFLDQLSAVFYFPDILGGVLFTNPQVLLDKATELVEKVHVLRSANCKVPAMGDMKTFRDYAQISPEFLSKGEELQKHYVPDLFTPVELVKLFRKLLIVADLSASKLFMPSLLWVLDEERVREYCVCGDSLAAALAVDFEGGPRLGVFCTLSCFLVSQDNQSPHPWKVKLLPKSTTPFCLYRNCIRFSVPDCPGSVTLIDTFTHFEVHISTQERTECAKVCSFVHSAIMAGLKAASATLNYLDLKPCLRLVCPCGEGSAHVAAFGEKVWICSLDSEVTGCLTTRQLVWKQSCSTGCGKFIFKLAIIDLCG